MRRKLRAEIDSLENRIKWINIAGMPVAVIIAGFGLAMMKRKGARHEEEAARHHPGSAGRDRWPRAVLESPPFRRVEQHRDCYQTKRF